MIRISAVTFFTGSSSGDREQSRQLLQSRSRLQSASGGRPLSPVDERLSSPSRGVRVRHFKSDGFDEDDRKGEVDEIPAYLQVDNSDTARFLISAEAKARRILLT